MADGWNPPEVGARASRSRAVTAEDIERFTAISGDRNPLHYDEAAARASRFGEIIVQGGITSAILNAVVAEAVELLLARGTVPDVFSSANLTGADETNRALLDTYAPRVRAL